MTDTKTTPADPQPGDAALVVPGDPEESIYRFIIVAAKRARQLQSGARPKIIAPARKMTKIAVEETRRGLVPYVDVAVTPPAPEEEEPISDQ
jgi:DNA-directed RNA polymerase subunit omega